MYNLRKYPGVTVEVYLSQYGKDIHIERPFAVISNGYRVVEFTEQTVQFIRKR